MDLELKPCPFCGNKVDFTHNIELEPDGIQCLTCHYIVRFPRVKIKPHDIFEVAMIAMAEVWNRRTSDDNQKKNSENRN